MARVLIVGGGGRGRALGRALVDEGYAVRITTRTEAGRAGIEAAGGECFIGTPDRVGSLRYALEGASLLCWLLGTATGGAAGVAALHGSRLEFMLGQIVDTTIRGVIYEGAGTVDPVILAAGARLVAGKAKLNAVPDRCLLGDPADRKAWLDEALGAIRGLMSGATPGSGPPT